MRVLVTGAAGFLGRHVARALAARGDHVVGIDTRPQDGLDGVEAVLGDVTDRSLPVRPAMSGADALVHLAAIASPRECEADPAAAFDVNVRGTYEMLRLAMRIGAGRFVLASTAHCYGIPPQSVPTHEGCPCRPHDTYAVTKILAERVCGLFAETHGMAVAVLRLYNGYGPGQAAGYFVPDMIAQARAGAVRLVGSDVTKDFLYVDDMVRAIVAATSAAHVGVVNVGSGTETSLESAARHIAMRLGVPFHAQPSGVPSRMLCDTRLATAALDGWRPLWSLDDGLHATILAACGRGDGGLAFVTRQDQCEEAPRAKA